MFLRLSFESELTTQSTLSSLRGIPDMRPSYLFTSESVSEGHPDKVCDRISDEIVDLVYREAIKTKTDPWNVRIACETLATTNRVVIAGRVARRQGWLDAVRPLEGSERS